MYPKKLYGMVWWYGKYVCDGASRATLPPACLAWLFGGPKCKAGLCVLN